MTTNEVVLGWVVALCEQAEKERAEGNVALTNKIGGNGGLNTFYANAFKIHSVQYSYFPTQFPAQWKEITGLYEAYQQEQLAEAAQTSKVDGIEERLGKLETLLTAFIESQKPAPAADEKPASKKAGKAAKKADVTEEAETEGEASEEA